MKLLSAIKGEAKHDFDMPETVEELTWQQAKQLVQLDGEDDFHVNLVAILTGISAEFWRETTDVDAFLQLAIECLHFLNNFRKETSFTDDRAMNPLVSIGEEQVQMPDDIGFESVGQYQDSIAYLAKWRNQYDEENHDVIETLNLYEKIFKIYLQPILQKKPYSHAEAMAINVDAVRFIHLIQWSSFFLASLKSWKPGIKQNAPRNRTPLKSKLLAFLGWLKSLAFWQRSTT